MESKDGRLNQNDGEYFHFKKFAVAQGNVTWKVGTDSILLGSWCDATGTEAALDLGTGTGLLALMIAQRNSNAEVTGIEVDGGTAKVAITNFATSLWAGRLNVIAADVMTWAGNCTRKFDLIVSNPPFFTHGLDSPIEKRRYARNGLSFGPEEVFSIASKLLNPTGKLSVILPFGDAEEYNDQGHQNGLYCTRKMHVRHREGAKWTRSLLEFSRTDLQQVDEDYLTLYEGSTASVKYQDLIAEFRDA